jgi:hypothetical protein
MATRLSSPVTREIGKESISSLLGVVSNRDLIVRMSPHGIEYKAKGRKCGFVLVPWDKIVRVSLEGMGWDQLRRDLR